MHLHVLDFIHNENIIIIPHQVPETNTGSRTYVASAVCIGLNSKQVYTYVIARHSAYLFYTLYNN